MTRIDLPVTLSPHLAFGTVCDGFSEVETVLTLCRSLLLVGGCCIGWLGRADRFGDEKSGAEDSNGEAIQAPLGAPKRVSAFDGSRSLDVLE